jgi:uncharacterized metal-binding protein YceD (DUF177 family)
MNHSTLPAKIQVSRVSGDSWSEYKMNKDTDWLGAMLNELNENATYRTPEMYFNSAYLDLDIKLKKKYRASMGEIVLLKCKLETTYYTQCVKTLGEMKDSLTLEFQAAFIHDHFENTPEYEESTEIFEENEVYELYYHRHGNVDLKEVIHEQIYLNYNQYPSLEPETQDDPNLDNLQ